MRLLLALAYLLLPVPVSAQCAHWPGPQHLEVTASKPLAGELVYCAKTEAERLAIPYLVINGLVLGSLERTCPSPAPADCTAYFPAGWQQALSRDFRRHSVTIFLKDADGRNGPVGAPFWVDAAGQEPVDPATCTYAAPNSTAYVQVPAGATRTGHNVMDPESQGDREKIALRLHQLRQWGWRVDLYPNFPAKKVLLLAMCVGTPQ